MKEHPPHTVFLKDGNYSTTLATEKKTTKYAKVREIYKKKGICKSGFRGFFALFVVIS